MNITNAAQTISKNLPIPNGPWKCH